MWRRFSGKTARVIMEREVDCGLVYQRVRRRLMAMLRSLDRHRLGTVVPATPAWSVRDAVAHVVGIAGDLNAQRFDVTDADAWTARQVRERRHATLDDLDVEWEHEAATFEEGLRVLGYEVGSHFVGDLFQHACDIHHALGLARIEDDEALVVGLDFYLDSCHGSLVAQDAGALGVQATESPEDRWTLGTGRELATLEAPRYELFRAFGGRRSESQLRRDGLDRRCRCDVCGHQPLPTPGLRPCRGRRVEIAQSCGAGDARPPLGRSIEHP